MAFFQSLRKIDERKNLRGSDHIEALEFVERLILRAEPVRGNFIKEHHHARVVFEELNEALPTQMKHGAVFGGNYGITRFLIADNGHFTEAGPAFKPGEYIVPPVRKHLAANLRASALKHTE